MGIFAVIVMYALWTTSFPIGKQMLEVAPPIFITGFRMTLAGVLLLGYLALFSRNKLKINKVQFFSLVMLAVLSVYLTNVLEYWGLKYLTAAKTCFIYSLSPFIAALLSYFHFNEKMTRGKWLGMVIGFTGFIPVIFLKSSAEGGLGAFAGFSWPELALAGAAFFSVYGWVLLRIVVKEHTISPLMANGTSMLIGGIMALGHSFFQESWSTGALGPVTSTTPFMKGIVLSIIISNLICFNLYGLMLKKYTATFLSFMGLLSPLFTSISSYFLIGEPLQWQIFFAFSIVSLGLWIVYRSELAQGYIVQEESEPAPAT